MKTESASGGQEKDGTATVVPIRPQSTVADYPGRGQGEPPGGGMIGERVAKLESDVEHIELHISEIKVDVKEIKSGLSKLANRAALASGGFAVAMAFLGWFVYARSEAILKFLAQ